MFVDVNIYLRIFEVNDSLETMKYFSSDAVSNLLFINQFESIIKWKPKITFTISFETIFTYSLPAL